MSTTSNLDAPVTINGVFAQIRAVMVERDRLRDSIERAAAALGLHDAANGDPASIISKCRHVLGAGPGETLLEACTRVAQRQPQPAPLTPERTAALDEDTEATARMVAAIQSQARDGETPDQTVERLIRERDGLRAERATWDSVEKERKKLATRVAELRDERERLRDALTRIAAILGVADTTDPAAIIEGAANAREELDEARLLGHAPGLVIAIQTAVPAIRDGLNAGGSHAPEAVRARNEARDSLHALEAAAEGQAAPAAVLSAAEVEALAGVAMAAEWAAHCDCEGGACRRDLRNQVQRWISAGRPLASEGKEG